MMFTEQVHARTASERACLIAGPRTRDLRLGKLSVQVDPGGDSAL
jgi:hypothetical protein